MLSALIIKPLNPVWWAFLFLAVVISIILWALRRNKENRNFLFGLSIFLVVYYVCYKLLLTVAPDHEFIFWNELPLHLCNLIAILTIFTSRMSDSVIGRSMKGFCFYGGILFAILAMMMPIAEFSGIPLFSIKAIGFYGFHSLLIITAISFATMKIYHPQLKDIPLVLALILIFGLLAHILNHVLRATVFSEANYFYTFGIEGNVIMDALRRLIPFEFVWILPLALPFAAVFACMTGVYNAITQLALHHNLHNLRSRT